MGQHYKKELKIPKNIKEACEVLGIGGKLTQEKISQVYKKLVLEYHPDKQSKNCKDLANTNAKALNLARDLLINAVESTTKYNTKACNKGEGEQPNKQDVKPTIANSFINKNLERARELIKQRGKNIPLGLFIKNACEDSSWCKLFEEFLSKWSGEIDLNTNVIIVSDTSKSIECTVLHYACIQKSRSVIELLLKHKADVNKVSYHSDKVPVCSALKNNDHNLASLLFQHGAKIDITTEVEQKIIDNSCSKYSKYTKKTMEVLLQYTFPKQNAKILKRFLNSHPSTNEDIEIVQLLNKEANLNYRTVQTAATSQLFLAKQPENLQLLTIGQKKGTVQHNAEITILSTIENRPKKILKSHPTVYSKSQEKEVKVMQNSVQAIDINNNQVTEKSSQNKKTKLTISKVYILNIACGVSIGVAIAYLVGVATLTPAITVFVAAAVAGALVGYSVSKFCEKSSEKRQNDIIGTAIKNVLTPERLRSQNMKKSIV